MELMAFQVTRRCNQVCNHCCKGKMQTIDMTKEIIDELFDSDQFRITEMTHLVITGGEPTLVPDIVEYLIDKIIKNEVIISKYVNIFTNGLIYSDKIIHSVNRLISYLKSREKCVNTKVNFKISNDQFHRDISKEVLDKYKNVEFIEEEWLKPYVLEKSDIQNDGNAKINNLGGKLDTSFIPSVNYISKEQNNIKVKNGICISANSNVCNEKCGCATFENEDEFAYGNVLNQSFLNIIENFSIY